MAFCKSTLKSKKWLLVMAAVVFLAGCKDSKAEDAGSKNTKQEESLSLPFIVVDLDGDGVELIPFEESNVYFDVDGDGLAERTAWVAPDDGVLMIYENAIDFGDTQISNKSKRLQVMATRGISLLRSFDKDKNKVVKFSFDPDRDNFAASFIIWKDANGNGFSERNEQLGFSIDRIVLPDISAGENNGGQEGRIETSDQRFLSYDEIRFEFSDDNVEWVIPPK